MPTQLRAVLNKACHGFELKGLVTWLSTNERLALRPFCDADIVFVLAFSCLLWYSEQTSWSLHNALQLGLYKAFGCPRFVPQRPAQDKVVTHGWSASAGLNAAAPQKPVQDM